MECRTCQNFCPTLTATLFQRLMSNKPPPHSHIPCNIYGMQLNCGTCAALTWGAWHFDNTVVITKRSQGYLNGDTHHLQFILQSCIRFQGTLHSNKLVSESGRHDGALPILAPAAWCFIKNDKDSCSQLTCCERSGAVCRITENAHLGFVAQRFRCTWWWDSFQSTLCHWYATIQGVLDLRRDLTGVVPRNTQRGVAQPPGALHEVHSKKRNISATTSVKSTQPKSVGPLEGPKNVVCTRKSPCWSVTASYPTLGDNLEVIAMYICCAIARPKPSQPQVLFYSSDCLLTCTIPLIHLRTNGFQSSHPSIAWVALQDWLAMTLKVKCSLRSLITAPKNHFILIHDIHKDVFIEWGTIRLLIGSLLIGSMHKNIVWICLIRCRLQWQMKYQGHMCS